MQRDDNLWLDSSTGTAEKKSALIVTGDSWKLVYSKAQPLYSEKVDSPKGHTAPND